MFGQKAQKIEWRRDALQAGAAAMEAAQTANFTRAAWAVTVQAAVFLATNVAQAADMTARINKATAPIMELAQAASYPVAYVMISCGFILIMVGKREAGFQLIRNGAIGFLGLQFVPIVMGILVEVAQAIRGA